MHSFRVALRIAALVFVALVLRGSYINQPAPSTPIFPSTGTPAFVRAVENHNSGAPTSLSVSFGTLPAVANIVIVGPETSSALGTGLNVTDNQGNSYSRLILQPSSSIGAVSPRVSLWCTVVATSSGTFTTTATVDTDSANALMQIFALEYAGTTCNPDALAGTIGSTSPYSCGSNTTRNGHDLLLTFLGTAGSTTTITYTAPASFTTRISQGVAATGITGAIADDIVTATSTYTPTFSASQNVAFSPCAFITLMSK